MTRIEYLAAAVGLAAVCYIVFNRLCSRAGAYRRALLFVAAIFPVPAYVMILNYITGVPDGDWYTDLRAVPGTESLLGLLGAPLGAVTALDWARRHRYAESVRMVCLAATIMLVCGPFLPDIYGRIDYTRLRDEWADGVCLQTSNSTCVPACLATMVRVLHGRHVTERQVAEAIGTTTVGADDWYIKRGLRKLGYEVRFGRSRSVKDAPVPCVLSTLVEDDIPHVVVLLDKSSQGVTIAEPLAGRREYDWRTFAANYRPDGSYMVLSSEF